MSRERLHLEGSWGGGTGRRFLESFREALGTGADPAQKVKRVNACAMAIAPSEVECVISNRRYVHSLQAGGYGTLENQPAARELFHAMGTRAVLAQIPRWVRTEMPVIPRDVGLKGIDTLDTSRRQIGHT